MNTLDMLPSIGPPAPAEDPLGLDAWAASHDLGPHTGLALAGAVLANIAGPSFTFAAPSVNHDAPGLNLAGVAGEPFLRMAVGELLASTKLRQDALLMRAREFTAEEIDAAMYHPALFGRGAEWLDQIADPKPAHQYDPVEFPEDKLSKDMEIGDRSIRYEALTRPRFLIPGAVPANPEKILAECHRGFGFAPGGAEVLPVAGQPRNRRVDDLMKYMRGAEITRSATRTKVTVETVWLRGIFMFPQADFNWLIDERRDFLSEAIPVSSAPANEAPPQVDETRAAGFRRLFDRASVLALSYRRAYACAAGRFNDAAAAEEFLRRQRVYLRELQGVPDECRINAAAGLPAVMAWALLLLAGRNNLDDYILHTAFVAARRLHADAVRLFNEHDQTAQAEQRLEVARQVFKRLVKIGPSKRRELVRGFELQKVACYEPIIRVLLDTGILTESPGRVLSIGQVPLTRLARNNFIELQQ